MKKIISTLLVFTLFWGSLPHPASAKKVTQKITNQIEMHLYSFRKNSDFMAVEVGFTNTSSKPAKLAISKFFVTDHEKYSVTPLNPYDLQTLINERRSRSSNVAMILAVILGAGVIIAGYNGSNSTARDLGLAALGVIGIYTIGSSLKSLAHSKQLVLFENNSVSKAQSIPPGMTVGGFIYFPWIKKPRSLVMFTGGSKKIEIPLSKGKSSQKTGQSKHSR